MRLKGLPDVSRWLRHALLMCFSKACRAIVLRLLRGLSQAAALWDISAAPQEPLGDMSEASRARRGSSRLLRSFSGAAQMILRRASRVSRKLPESLSGTSREPHFGPAWAFLRLLVGPFGPSQTILGHS